MNTRGRCLFVVWDGPIGPNVRGGGAAVHFSHLELLAHAGWAVTVVTVAKDASQNRSMGFEQQDPGDWTMVRDWCESCYTIPFGRVTRASAPVRHLLTALRDPLSYVYGLEAAEATDAFRRIVDRVQPDIIWAEDLAPALLAVRTVSDRPVIYAHHDWEWRIGKLRSEAGARGWRRKLRWWLQRRAEQSLTRRVAACVCGSATEAAEVRALGLQHVHYLPTTYAPLPPPDTAPSGGTARIVHLGGMRTTANRLGLQRFLDVAWPVLLDAVVTPPELWVIGDLEGAPDRLLGGLQRVGAVCTGFVPNLRALLRPGDLHIVPWEHNTGTRARVPLVMNHGQVIVATSAGVDCLPELQSGINCVLVDGLASMGHVLAQLLDDPARRAEIARAGHATFLKHFTREAVQPRFDDFMDRILPRAQLGRPGGASRRGPSALRARTTNEVMQ